VKIIGIYLINLTFAPSLFCVVNKLYKFVDRLHICPEAIMIRYLCIEYDGYFNILDSEQMCHMIEYLYTI